MSADPVTTLVDLSIVIPMLNERDSVQPLYDEIRAVLDSLDLYYEFVFVDDGSTDAGFEVIAKLHAADPRVRAIRFRRNFGKAAALSAGFAAARGDLVITMDADLQDDPAEIPRFLARLDEGYDLVSGWKYPRRDPWTKTFPSRMWNRAVSLLSGVRLHDFNCGFKAYRREVTQEFDLYGDLYRYIPVLAHWRGFRVTEIQVHHRPRRFGRSKYGVMRFLRGAFDLMTVIFLTQYNMRPLHFFGWAGLAAFGSGFLVNLYLTLLWFQGEVIHTRPLLTLGVLLMVTGVQFFSFGLLADMLTKAASSDRPFYSVRQTLDDIDELMPTPREKDTDE